MSTQEVLEVIKAMGSPIRYGIIQVLSKKEDSFTGIMSKIGMDSSTNEGKFGHHLRELKEACIVETLSSEGNGLYCLTGLGKLVYNNSEEIEQCLKEGSLPHNKELKIESSTMFW